MLPSGLPPIHLTVNITAPIAHEDRIALAQKVPKANRLLSANIMKKLLTLAVLAISFAAPVFADKSDVSTQGIDCPKEQPSGSLPDGGATALLAAISFGGLYIAKRATKKS